MSNEHNTSRREFLSLAALASATPALDQPTDTVGSSVCDEQFRQRTAQLRADLEKAVVEQPIAPHPTNGDEARDPHKIGSDSRVTI